MEKNRYSFEECETLSQYRNPIIRMERVAFGNVLIKTERKPLLRDGNPFKEWKKHIHSFLTAINEVDRS